MTPVWTWLGRVPFDRTLLLQEQIRAGVLRGDWPETLLLCEHEPVITMGRGARSAHVLASAAELAARGIALRPASRGGDVTYHGPGQLVGYPVFRLRKGVVGHMESMAATIVAVLAELGLVAQWRRMSPGVWVGPDKICAFGVHVSQRVAIHGFALNVCTDLDAFSTIVPCGLRDGGVTSVARLLSRHARLLSWEPWEGSHTLPRLAPASEARLRHTRPSVVPPLQELAARVADAFARELGARAGSPLVIAKRDPQSIRLISA